MRNSLAETFEFAFRSTWSNASGVTSRPVIPVPPVVITTSMSRSTIQARRWAFGGCASVVLLDRARRDAMAGLRNAFDQRVARPVIGERARVRHGEDGDVDRLEGLGFVNFVHASIVTILACRGEAAGLDHGS